MGRIKFTATLSYFSQANIFLYWIKFYFICDFYFGSWKLKYTHDKIALRFVVGSTQHFADFQTCSANLRSFSFLEIILNLFSFMLSYNSLFAKLMRQKSIVKFDTSIFFFCRDCEISATLSYNFGEPFRLITR